MKLLIALLFSTTLFASFEDITYPAEPGDHWYLLGTTPTVTRNYSGEIYLASNDKAIHKKNLAEMEFWFDSYSRLATSSGEVSRYQSDITNRLPQWIRDLVWSYVYGDEGSNCWNLALYSRGLAYSLAQAQENEFTFILNSSLCEEVQYESDIEPGDIAAIRARATFTATGEETFAEIHGATVFTSDLFLTKNGGAEESPIRIQNQLEVLSNYMQGNPTHCAFQVGTEGSCERWANYYRCRPIEDAVNESRDDRYFTQLHDQLTELGSELTALMASEENFSWVTHSTYMDYVPEDIMSMLDEEIFWERDSDRLYEVEKEIQRVARKNIAILKDKIEHGYDQELASIYFLKFYPMVWRGLDPEYKALYQELSGL